MTGRLSRFLLGVFGCALTVLVTAPAHAAGELDLAGSAGVATSAGNGWRGDGAIPTTSLRAAYRFPMGIGPVFVGREGYAKVDERLLTLVSLGAQGWLDLGGVRPYVRLSWVHQHEESVSFAKEEPFGILFGVGRGIRHRGGVETAIGVDIPFARSQKLTWFAAVESYADWVFAGEAPGPSRYFGGTLGVGLDFRL